MKSTLSLIGFAVFAATSLTLAAPIFVTAIELDSSAQASHVDHTHHSADLFERRTASEVATVQVELTSRAQVTEKISDERQLLPRTSTTLDLLSKLFDTPSNVVHGAELPSVGSDVAGGSDGISTELRMLTGSNVVPLHPTHEFTLPALNTMPSSQNLLGRARWRGPPLTGTARWRGQQAAGSTNPQAQRLTGTESHVELPTGKAKWRRPALLQQASVNKQLGMTDRDVSAPSSRHDDAASPLPPSTSPHQQQTATASLVRASDGRESERESTPSGVSNGNVVSNNAPADAVPVDTTTSPATHLPRDAGKASTSTNPQVKAPAYRKAPTVSLAEFVRKQEVLLEVHLEETAYGSGRERSPKVIEAEKYIVAQYKKLKPDSPVAELRLVKKLQSATNANALAKAGIIKPEDFKMEEWEEAISIIKRRYRHHWRTGSYQPQLLALEMRSKSAAHPIEGDNHGRTGGPTGASNRGPSTGVGNAAGSSKRLPPVNRSTAHPNAKRPRAATNLGEFVQLQVDLLNLAYPLNVVTADQHIVEIERYIISQIQELKPVDDAHAEELLHILQSSQSSRTLAKADIVRPVDRFEDERPWEFAVGDIYRRYKTHIYSNTFAKQLEALRQSRLREQARSGVLNKPK